MPLPLTKTCSASDAGPIRQNADGSFSIRIAVNDEDMYGRRVDLSKLDLSRYLKNPVVLLNHGHVHPFPIGRSLMVCSGPEGIEADFVFAKNDAMASQAKNLMRQGIMRSASIGWYVDGGVPYLAEWTLCSVGLDPGATALGRDRLAGLGDAP